jgi:glycerol-3-phosphate acyltransferase PlsY
MIIATAVAVSAGYLLGSVSPGLLIGRLHGVDVREFGSGKTGVTNVLRSVGRLAAAVVFFADIGKGTIAVLIGSRLFDEPWAAALGGVAVVVGHNWPVFAGFRGGRGVATAFGAFLAIDPVSALLVLIAGGVALVATRYMSLVSVTGVLLGTIVLITRVNSDAIAAEYVAFVLPVATMIEINHVGNIRRLLAGTEPKLGQGGTQREQPGT